MLLQQSMTPRGFQIRSRHIFNGRLDGLLGIFCLATEFQGKMARVSGARDGVIATRFGQRFDSAT